MSEPKIRLPHPPVPSKIKGADDARKRQIGFALKARTVLLKTYGNGPVDELQFRPRDREAVEAAQVADGDRRGVAGFVQRADRPDHGFPVFQKERLVSLAAFLDELSAAGFIFDAHEAHRYFDKKKDGTMGKGDVNVFPFRRANAGESVAPVPDFVREALAATFNNVSVWVNVKAPEGESRYRLDTIDAAAYSQVGTAEVLHLHGNSYKLMRVADPDELIRQALAAETEAEARRAAANPAAE